MPQLALNQPLNQSAGTLLVENPLPVGRHRFSLVVVDDRGRASEPALLVVTVGPPPSPVTGPAPPVRRPRRGGTPRRGPTP